LDEPALAAVLALLDQLLSARAERDALAAALRRLSLQVQAQIIAAVQTS
jgi:hypothetical protein